MDASPSSHPPKPKPKAKKSYPHPPKKSSSSSSSHTAPPTIQPGDAGIWATCTKGKEGKATVDLLDLFAQFAEALYGIHDNTAPAPAPASSTPASADDTAPLPTETTEPTSHTTNGAAEEDDIETSITAELSTLRHPNHPSPNHTPTKLIQPIRLSTPCLLFFRTLPPLDPVVFVTTICRHFASPSPSRRPPRFIKRLTPLPLISKATPTSLVSTARTVLSSAGLTSPPPSPPASSTSASTFAIRPTIRDHHTLSRTQIIETVAPLVGDGWKVDLTKPGWVVCVEVWRNVCGVVVVEGQGWRELGRFNLAELGGGDKGAKGEEGADGKAVNGEKKMVDGGGAGGGGKLNGESEGGKRKRDGADDEEEGRVVKMGREEAV